MLFALTLGLIPLCFIFVLVCSHLISFYTSILHWLVQSYVRRYEFLTHSIRLFLHTYTFKSHWPFFSLHFLHTVRKGHDYLTTEPIAIYIMSVSGFLLFFLAIIGFWPVWGFFSIPIVLMNTIGLVLAPNLIPVFWLPFQRPEDRKLKTTTRVSED